MAITSTVREKPRKGEKVKVDRRPKNRRAIKARWWEEPAEDVWRSAIAIQKTIEDDQGGRREMLVACRGFYEAKVASAAAIKLGGDKNLTYNVVRSCVNTASSKISKNKPRPLIVTTDGSYDEQVKAKKLKRYLDGTIEMLDLDRKWQKAFRDCGIGGDGAVRFFIEDRKICAERVPVDEIFVDEGEAYYGAPRQMHHRRYMSRDVLQAVFGTPPANDVESPAKEGEPAKAKPDYANITYAIDNAPAADVETLTGSNGRYRANDMIVVVESWHLPSAEHADDGRHVISIDGAALVDEPYEHDYFPIALISWEESLDGFWGTGLAEELAGLQLEINELLLRIRLGHKHCSAPTRYVEVGSKVVKGHFNNDPRGNIVEYQGIPPKDGGGIILSPELYAQLETYYRRAFEITGVSAMSAQAKKPGGLDSGVALREWQDIESERFILIGQRYEAAYMQSCRIIIDLARELYEKHGVDLPVKSKARKFIESIKWSDVDMDDDVFDMQMFPVSALPSTPAGKIQTVTELMGAKDENGKPLITGEQAMKLLDFPDLEEAQTLRTAAYDDAMMVISSMLEGGPYVAPEPFMDLDLTQRLAQSSYLKARTQRVDEKRLALIRDFMGDVQRLIEKASPPPPPPMPMGPPPPMIPPGGMPPGPGPGGPMPMPGPMPPMPPPGAIPAAA